jgi:hypothetical protein
MKYEIEIPRTILQKSFLILLIAISLAGLVLLGYKNSPVGLSGRPVLLSPHLAGLIRYQHSALRWAGELREVQVNLGSLLENPPADLLAQDRQANGFVDQVSALQAEVEDTTVPPTLQVLHNTIQTAVEQTAQATGDALTWISEPSADNHATAMNALGAACAVLARLDQDPWMQQP